MVSRKTDCIQMNFLGVSKIRGNKGKIEPICVSLELKEAMMSIKSELEGTRIFIEHIIQHIKNGESEKSLWTSQRKARMQSESGVS